MNTAGVLVATAVGEAKNMNTFENQASRFHLAVEVGHGKQTNKNASEHLVLIKGMLPQRPQYPVLWNLIQHTHGPYSLL